MPYNQSNAGRTSADQVNKLFIGGLSYETDEKGLKEYFGKYGEILDVVVMKDPQTKRSRGFGFITFKDVAPVDEVQKKRPHKLDGRTVETKRAMPRDDLYNQVSVKKMFVGGLKDDTTEEMVRECFSGKIDKLEMIKDKTTGKSRGFCFITFDDHDIVDQHILQKYFDLNGRQVEVKKAFNKDEPHQFNRGRGGYGPQAEFGYGPGYGMGGGGGNYGGYRPASGRGGYGGGNYGNQGGYGGYGNQGWNQGGYGDFGYGGQGGWGGAHHYGYGPAHMKGGYGGGNNYNNRR